MDGFSIMINYDFDEYQGFHATPTYQNLAELTVVIGTVVSAVPHPKARKPMIIVEIDFGPMGIKTTSAMITDLYTPERLVGRQVVAATGLPVKLVAGVKSEVLLLAATTDEGSVLIGPDRITKNGVAVR
jgi:tRNA-binding protein